MQKILLLFLIILASTAIVLPYGVSAAPCPANQIQINGVCVTPPERCFPTPGPGIPIWDPFCISETICRAPATVKDGVCVNNGYQLLAPLPSPDGNLTNFDPQQEYALGGYLNVMIKIIIGLSAVMAVVMIVLGGIEYMTSELVSSKENGKQRITNAIFGLVIALGAYALLNTINPDLLKTDLKSLTAVTVEVDIEADVPQTYDPVTKKYSNGRLFGANWQQIAGNPFGLPPFATINARECTTIGEQFCTSTAGLDTTPLYTINKKCPACALRLTGGTEFWLHGGKTGSTSHGPNSATMDISKNDALNKYIAGNNPLITFRRYSNGDGLNYMYEGSHWHIGP